MSGRGSASAPDLRATSTGFAERKPPINSAELNAFHGSLDPAQQEEFEEIMRDSGIVRKKRPARKRRPLPDSDGGIGFPMPFTVNLGNAPTDPELDEHFGKMLGKMSARLWSSLNPAVYPVRTPASLSRASYMGNRGAELFDQGGKEFNRRKNDLTLYAESYHATKSCLRDM